MLSFPPHLVREYLARFALTPRQMILDPFCGTGTVLVECKKLGIPSMGVEANPVAHFASRVKTDWSGDPAGLLAHARRVAAAAAARLAADGLEDAPLFLGRQGLPPSPRTLPPEAARLLLADSISPLPLHKVLVLRDTLDALADPAHDRYERLALAKAVVTSISNLHFGPEVGVGPAKADAPVLAPWLAEVARIAADLETVRGHDATPTTVHLGDARDLAALLPPASVDAVITSPPYPNEKDYTRTTRLEAVLLGFLRTRADLRALKQGLVRSNTRGVYQGDDDNQWVREFPAIERLARAIEARRLALGKTSGFERLYHRVTRLYFGGMARHLANLRPVLRPGAYLAYVVGDQASYLRVLIRTGELLAAIGETLGYQVVAIDLFRTRLATATREQLREEVVVLRWPGAA